MKKSLCFTLCLLLIFGQASAIFAQQTQMSKADREQMLQTAAERQIVRRKAEIEIEKLPLCDRYIVKMKAQGSVLAANSGFGVSVEEAVSAAKQAADMKVQKVLTEKQVTDTELFNMNEKPTYFAEEIPQSLTSVVLTEKVDLETFVQKLSDNTQIEYVQPDYELELASDDLRLDIDLSGTEATAIPVSETPAEIMLEIEPSDKADREPDPTPIAAVIDGGVDVTHSGLSGHLREGYDFVNGEELFYKAEYKDEYYHGTHVAGIIAQNSPETQILPLKVFENGRAYTSDIISAIEYARQHGAKIVNMSFGGKDNNRALREAMAAANDVLFVCAAGNARTNLEMMPIYPASFDLDNIISVASLNQDLGFSYYSNYGTESVDIAAVGRDVESTLPEGAYGEMSGTSMAAAQVSAGAAKALVRGDADVKAAVLNTADKMAHLGNKVAYGRSFSMSNLACGLVSSEIQTAEYEEDFDVHGYQPTPEESWELFSALENVQVAAGIDTSYVVKSDGTVWGWGSNENLALGENASLLYRPYPAQIPGLTDVVRVSAGDLYCYALKSDGTVMAWGKNEYGMLGTNVGTASLPRVIQTNAKYAAAGDTNSVVVKTDGTVTIRGDSQFLPDSDVSAITGVEKAAAHRGQFALLKEDGTVLSWGRLIRTDSNGGINRNKTPYIQPVLNNVRDIAIGYYETYMVTEDNKLYCGGEYNETPRVYSENIKNVTAVEEQIFLTYTDGTAKGTGSNLFRQLGAGEDIEQEFIAQYVPVAGVSNIEMISTYYRHTIALCSDGTIWVWGDNSLGQLGTGDCEERRLPIPLAFGSDRDGSTYEKAYFLVENTAVVPENTTRDNWFEFTPNETGRYIISSYNSSNTYINGYLYKTDTPTSLNYIQSSESEYSRSYFHIEAYLTKNQRYYIRADHAPQGKGYGVRVENADRALSLLNTRVATIEAEDMVQFRYNRNGISAEYSAVTDTGASGGKALLASGSYPGDNKINETNDIYMPPLSFTLCSNVQKRYYFWVRSKVTDTSQDSLWFGAGELDGYAYANKGLNIGTMEQPWTWTLVAERSLWNGYHTIAICPREFGGLIDKVLVTDDSGYVPSDIPESEYLVYEMENGAMSCYSAGGVDAEYVSSEDAFASGAASVTAYVSGIDNKVSSVSAEAVPAMTFTVPIQNEDKYSVWVRARKIDSSSDSVWVAFDEQDYVYTNLSHAAEDTWVWTKLMYKTMTAGEHTLKLVPREEGGIFDKIAVCRGNIRNAPNDAMVNGHAVFEMEDCTITPYTSPEGETADFTVITDEYASGGKALAARADNGYLRMDGVYASSTPVINCSFYVDKPDVYDVYFRARIESYSQNSIWVGADDTPYEWRDLPVNDKEEQNGYKMVYAGSFTLRPGCHTVKIIPREADGIFDQLIVTNNRNFGTMENYMVGGNYTAYAEHGLMTPFDDGTNSAAYRKTRAIRSSNGVAMRARVVSPVWGGKIDSTNGISEAVLRFETAVEKTGTYAVWARVCANSSASDSLWLKNGSGRYVQKGLPINADEDTGNFTWTKLDTVRLSAGSYTLSFIPRENDCLIDKVMLTADLTYVPPETVLSENPSAAGTVHTAVTIREGEEKLIVLSCTNVPYERFGNFVFSYNSADIEIVDLAAQIQGQTVTEPGTYGLLKVISADAGSAVFLPAIIPEPGMAWSGAVTVVKVRGLRNCESSITFSR